VREKALIGGHEFTAVLPSKMTLSGPGRRRDEETVNAIKNRFLECHIRRRPENRMKQFKRLGTFKRIHFVLAMFTRIVDLLEKYKPADFYSEAVYFYALSGLKLNAEYFDSFYHFVMGQVCGEKQRAETVSWQERVLRLESLAVESEPDLGINMEEEWATLLS
jgi:hypothetical protein